MSIGAQTVFTYVLIYSFGMLIGQDIWQRVFTARSDRVARVGGTVAGTYCLVYALGGRGHRHRGEGAATRSWTAPTTRSRRSSATRCRSA